MLLRILVSDDEPVALSGAAILQEGLRLAGLSKAPAGGIVLLLLPHSVELFLLHIGLILTGRVPAILAWPTNRVDPEKYQCNLLHQFRNLPARELITIPSLAANLASVLPYEVSPCAVMGMERWEKAFSVPTTLLVDEAVSFAGDSLEHFPEALFLQFSGGTTGAQKAVVITSSMLVRQLHSLGRTLRFSRSDVVISWLPLYHDMGLIACFWLPLWHTALSVQFAASSWLLKPGLLFEFLERYAGTFCWLPNFAFSYLAGQRPRMGSHFSLGHVRAFINCSEPVRAQSLQNFVDAFDDWGISAGQMQASYAMAENVFAVTQTCLGQSPMTVPRSDSAATNRSGSLAFDLLEETYVSSGRPIDGVRVRIANPDGTICAEREPGEIQLSTESLFSGYWPARSSGTEPFTFDGWYATGDYGFLADGELFVVGRLKDIVIVAGQNIFPEDVEAIVNRVAGIYPGRVVAFGMPAAYGTESLIVVAELKGPYEERRAIALEKEIAQAVVTAIGIAPEQVRVVPERWIVKSTAGKISRRETRERYRNESGPRPIDRASAFVATR